MSDACRRPCKECPWTNDSRHNIKFREWSERMESMGKKQACHMETSDVWGRHTKVGTKNECVGRKLMMKKTIGNETEKA